MNFDFNIENYTRNELIEMFDLPHNFDKNILEMKETKLKDSIFNNREINKEIQTKTMNFLVKAKSIILNKNQNDPIKNFAEQIYHLNYDLKSSKLEDNSEHMVQVRESTPYIGSAPSDFHDGIINPLKKKVIKKNLNIDTRFRENYYNSSATNFNIGLPTTFNNVLQMQLNAIELPTTFYVVSKQYGNNFFTIVVDGNQQVIHIPSGNYDRTTIMNTINTELTNLGGSFASITFTCNYTISTTGITGSGQTLVGFNVTPIPPGSTLELNFQADKFGIDDRNTPLPLKLGWILGFRNGIYVNNLNYVSEGIVDLTGPKYVYLVVDDYNKNVVNSFYSAFNSSLLNKNILARIAIQGPPITIPLNVLEQNNLSLVTTPREYFGPINLQTMNIQLLDEYGRTVDLNNMDFSFCLTLTTAYDL
jgi:hypothetical protein